MRLLMTAALLLMTSAVRAELPLLNGNLELGLRLPQVQPEPSADLVLQLPEQIDGWAPVPLHLSVLVDGVESIRLLTSGPEAVELAAFELSPRVRPDLVTRYHPQGEAGMEAQVRTAERLLVQRRVYRQTSGFPLPEAEEAPTVSEPPELTLRARRNPAGLTLVELDGALPLVEAVQHPQLLRSVGPQVSRFRLLDPQQQLLLAAELSPALALQPYLQLKIDDLAPGDELRLRWQGPSGEAGEIMTRVEGD